MHTGQAFVPELHRQSRAQRESLGEFSRVFGLAALVTTHMARLADQDQANFIGLRDFRQVVQVISDARPLECRQALGSDTERIAQCNADSSLSNVEGHHTARQDRHDLQRSATAVGTRGQRIQYRCRDPGTRDSVRSSLVSASIVSTACKTTTYAKNVNRRTALQLFGAALGSGFASAQNQVAKDRHVIVISVDGLANYALEDSSVPLPAIRRLAANGSVAAGSQVVNPAVTWPNHTSMVTGVTPARHLVLYNGLPVRRGAGQAVRVEPWVDKPELVKAPTVYDAAHAAGLTTAEVDWVAIQNASTITWAFPERPRLTDPIVKEMIADGKVREADIREFAKANIVWRDEIWTQAGEHIIENHKPNLLLFHLLTTDSCQHRYGARSLGGNTALTLADTRIQRLLNAVQRAGIRERTTVFIVSDHGFKTFHTSIHPNVLLRQRGLLRESGGNIECDAWVISEGGTAMVYVTQPERRTELVDKLRTEFSAIKGIRQVIGPDDFERLGYPLPQNSDRMADLVLAAEDDHSFSGVTAGEVITKVADDSSPGAHGYLNSDADMNAVFVASGAGIKPGVKLPLVRNIDVAPTVARLLGLEMKDVDGRVLTQALA